MTTHFASVSGLSMLYEPSNDGKPTRLFVFQLIKRYKVKSHAWKLSKFVFIQMESAVSQLKETKFSDVAF